MTQPIDIAVISDIHVGLDARSADLCPVEHTKAIEKDYREQFLARVRQKDLRADYLVCPGDATSRAEVDEFKLASDFIAEAAEALNVDPAKVLFVPGNHDVSWALINALRGDAGRKLRYHPLAEVDHSIRRAAFSADGTLVDEPYLAVWDHPDMLAVGHNSSWHDDPAIAHHGGLISRNTLHELDKLLGRLDVSDGRLRVFLIHHHPLHYNEPVPEDVEVSILTNAESLLQLLRRYHFDVLIHGHKHNPRFNTHVVNSEFPIAILGAGSFSALLDTRWSGEVQNQFHLLRVAGRDAESGCVFGELESWAFVHSRGWVPSGGTYGIQHRLAFGAYVLPQALDAKLQAVIEKQLAISEHVTWPEIVEMDPTLRYLPHVAVFGALERVCTRLSLRRYGDIPAEVILLRPKASS